MKHQLDFYSFTLASERLFRLTAVIKQAIKQGRMCCFKVNHPPPLKLNNFKIEKSQSSVS